MKTLFSNWKCGIFVIESENEKPYGTCFFFSNGKVELMLRKFVVLICFLGE